MCNKIGVQIVLWVQEQKTLQGALKESCVYERRSTHYGNDNDQGTDLEAVGRYPAPCGVLS